MISTWVAPRSVCSGIVEQPSSLAITMADFIAAPDQRARKQNDLAMSLRTERGGDSSSAKWAATPLKNEETRPRRKNTNNEIE
jgi:hypothetical protein